MIWQKREVYNLKNEEIIIHRYQWVGKGRTEDYTIDVNITKDKKTKGVDAQVSVYTIRGFILGTPKFFSDPKQVYSFVAKAKKQIEQGQVGKVVFFTA